MGSFKLFKTLAIGVAIAVGVWFAIDWLQDEDNRPGLDRIQQQDQRIRMPNPTGGR